MDLTEALRAVAYVLHLSCPNVEQITVDTLPWPAAYIRSDDGRNILVWRKGTEGMNTANRIAIHELIHCGIWEQAERQRAPHPRYLDPREELQVQALTDIVIQQYYNNRPSNTQPRDD